MDTLDLKNLSNRTKIILTKILNTFLEEHKNDRRYSELIISKNNQLLKTQLFIIFGDSKLFSKSMNYLNIPNSKLIKYLHNIKTFFDNDNSTKQSKGIDFILNKSGLNDQYFDIIPLLDDYEQLYDNIRYNQKVINFINESFPQTFKDEIIEIFNSLVKFDNLYKKYKVSIIEEKINTIKQFYNTEDKEIFIISQKSIIENKITNFYTNLSNNIQETNIDFNFDEFKPNDISVMQTLDSSAEENWNQIISETRRVVYDTNPDKYFENFVALFKYFKETEKKFKLDDKNINELMEEIQNYNTFITTQNEILNNMPYYNNETDNNEFDNENFIKFLKNIPEKNKRLLKDIKNSITTMISTLFTNINYNYLNGFKEYNVNDTGYNTDNDLFKIQWFDKNIDKQRVSYNVLLIFVQTCAKILIHKNNINEYQNILPIGLYPDKIYKYESDLYVYILTKIFTNVLKQFTEQQSCMGDNCKDSVILMLTYIKILRTLKPIITDENNELFRIINEMELEDFNFSTYIEGQIKGTSTIKNIMDNMIFNMDYYQLPTRNTSLNKKIEQQKINFTHKNFIKECIDENNEKLRKKYLTTKTSNNSLIKKLISAEKNDDKEWNIMMNNNYQIFIAYFSNMFHKIKLNFSDGTNSLYSFENFNKMNICVGALTEYKPCYETNYYIWVKEVSNLLPLENYINIYIDVYKQYIEKNLYKIIDNRIILVNTKDELKYYKTLKTQKEQNSFIELVLQKQNITNLTSNISSFFNFYTNEKKFYDNLYNICLSNENVFNIIINHISNLEQQIEKEEEDLSAIELLLEELDDDEMVEGINNKRNLLNIKKHFLNLIISKKFENKFEKSELETEHTLEIELVKAEINIKEEEEEIEFGDDDDEEEREYGETEEPDDADEADIANQQMEFDDFEQQTQIDIQDIIDKQQRNKKELLKQWGNTLSKYLDIQNGKNIMDKILQIVDNIEYKNSNQKKIHEQFAKFLKNEYLSTNSFSDIKKLKFDKKLRKTHYEFLNNIEYDIFKILLILYTITYNLDQIVKQKIDICNIPRIKSFIKEQRSKNTDSKVKLSKFVTIINGRWNGFTGTIVSSSNDDKIIEAKKKIINNLKSSLLYYKKLRKTFLNENWLSKFPKYGKNDIINRKKEENQQNFLKIQISKFEQELDTSIATIKKTLTEKINEFKNNYIYVTLDRYGINTNKYVPHIKQIKLKLQDVEFSKLPTSKLASSITNKFEEVKGNLSGKKTLENNVKCLYYILEIFHNSLSKTDFEEAFEKNYFIYVYNFAFQIYIKQRALEKRKLIIELDNEYNINNLKLKLNTGILNNSTKRRLLKQIAISETKDKILNIEDKYHYLFETYDDKKPRKETVTLFKNLYINNKGTILPEYEISVMKQISKKQQIHKTRLIKKLNNQFDSFINNVKESYKQPECDIINILKNM